MSDATAVILKAFDEPDELREMTLGRFELITLGGRTIGRATYQPGWNWSEHVGPGLGQERCPVEHVGLVLSGTATAAFADGGSSSCGPVRRSTSRRPHDSWVVGDEPYVSLHLVGAEHYATDD